MVSGLGCGVAAILVGMALVTIVEAQTGEDPLVGTAPPGLEFLGRIAKQGIYLGTQAATQPEAIGVCKKLMSVSGQPGYLVALDERDTPKAPLYDLLTAKAEDIKDFWITGRIELRPPNKEIWVLEGPFPRREEDATGRGWYIGTKSKRYARLFTPKDSLSVITRGKREVDEFVVTSEGPVTITETHFPWVPQWNGTDAGACHMKECKPRRCKITTPPCKLTYGKCVINQTTDCQLIGSHTCKVVPKMCNVTQPRCAVYPTSCPLKTPRKCRVEPPSCTVISTPCTVERLPCVTKYPPCHVVTENITCHQAPCAVISEPDWSKCARLPRDCTAAEMAAGKSNCTYFHCPPGQSLCLKPEVCRQEVLKCPTPYTFCPPVSVHCPAPYVNCTQPRTVCSPPEFDCPFPQVVCEQPTLDCTEEVHVCNTPKTKCFPSPSVNCPPAKVECPPPTLECEEPPPCTPVFDSPCVENPCKENCNCLKLRCFGIWLPPDDRYRILAAQCEERHRALCVTNFK